jgi:hypothetical protein
VSTTFRAAALAAGKLRRVLFSQTNRWPSSEQARP